MIPLAIPTLMTDRLLMVPLSMEHSRGMFHLWKHPSVAEFSGDIRDSQGNELYMPASAAEDTDKLIKFWIDAANDGWGLRWAILNEQRVFVGHIGFNSIVDCAEIAFHLNPEYWGNGIMREAAESAISWRKQAGSSAIEAYIHTGNSRSIALVSRLGMCATDSFLHCAQRYLKVL